MSFEFLKDNIQIEIENHKGRRYNVKEGGFSLK